MHLLAVPADIRRHGWVVLGFLGAVGLAVALPARGEDVRGTGGITEQLTALVPPRLVTARIFSPVKWLQVRPRGAGPWVMQDFSIAAGGLESDVHQAEVLITLQSSAVGETVVELLGGVGSQRPAQLRVGNTTVRAGDGPVTLAANTRGQIAGTLISSDTMNAVLIKAGGKVSPQIRFDWENNDALDAWVSRPLVPVPGVMLTEMVTLKLDGQPLESHRLHFFVKRVEIEDDDGHRTQREFTADQPGDAYAVYEQAAYVTDAQGVANAKLTVKDRPEVVNIVRSYFDESVFLADAMGRVRPAVPALATRQMVDRPLGNTTELIQRLKRFGGWMATSSTQPAKDDPRVAALLEALRREVAEHPAERQALAYYVAELYAALGDPRAAAEWAMPVARDGNNPNCAEARRVLARCGVSWEAESTSAAKPEGDALLRAAAEVYPCGRDADELAGRVAAHAGATANAWNALLPQNPDAAEKAGDLYRSMNMLPEAVKAYRLCLGLNGDFFSGETAPVWMRMGDCLADQGRALEAVSCYYKSLAGGQPLQDITHRIRGAQAALGAPAAAPVPPQPDEAVLEQVAGLLADSNLFNDALAAAQSAQRARGTPTELVPALHQKKSAWLRKVLEAAGEGVVVRGIKVTAEAIRAEEAAGR